MFDLALNEDFEVYIDHRGDLASVDGRRGFEQAVLLHLTERFSGLINSFTEENLLELASVEARRVANDMDMLNQVASFDARFSRDDPERLLVDIVYESGDISELEVEG